MIQIPVIWSAIKAVPWRLIVLILGTLVLIFAGWRVSEWRQAFNELESVKLELVRELDAVKAELVREQACEPATACERRAEEQAATARREAEERAQSALESALAAESKARADAAAWRAKYRAAIQSDPDCAAWASAPIRCPL